jgi:hypothetical protein
MRPVYEFRFRCLTALRSRRAERAKMTTIQSRAVSKACARDWIVTL